MTRKFTTTAFVDSRRSPGFVSHVDIEVFAHPDLMDYESVVIKHELAKFVESLKASLNSPEVCGLGAAITQISES